VSAHPIDVPLALSTSNLTVTYGGGTGPAVVRDIDLRIAQGHCLALVGESGCGKSTILLALAGLLPSDAKAEGEISVAGSVVAPNDEAAWARLRGSHIGFVFQNAALHLDPLMRIERQLAESFPAAWRHDRQACRTRSVEWLERVGITEPTRVLRAYPHELSGGLCQRVMLAIAFAGNPKVILADEPTTALDAVTQSRVLATLRELCAERDTGVLLVTHDLDVAAEVCDTIAVMYGGRVVEMGPAAEVLETPRHPYTRTLVETSSYLDEFRPHHQTPAPCHFIGVSRSEAAA
jgi:ABC-type dipeptide/oligopeptide/nickel transport system ATPase component